MHIVMPCMDFHSYHIYSEINGLSRSIFIHEKRLGIDKIKQLEKHPKNSLLFIHFIISDNPEGYDIL